MVINPDVTVRSRGVMEKCSMCIQRIQAGKLEAKKEKRRPIDGEIQVACAQSCPTDAITFGDMNDETTAISKLLTSERKGRAFGVIEEINVKPSISYLVKIRNKDEKVNKEGAVAEHKEHA
jgi:molybdopterin-containing oxidoreductase family iron-sulfur binding subunit